MSSMIDMNGGGLDLSSLSKFERWLLGMLGREIWISSSFNFYAGRRYNQDPPYPYEFAMPTNLYSITIANKDCGTMTQGNAALVFEFNPYDSATEIPKGQTVEYVFNERDKTVDNGRVSISCGNANSYAVFEITAFTTIDGKVHTYDNPNY